MKFAANFTAIDFETASRQPDSACQLAAVKVRQGQIVDQAMWMIRPRPFYFSPTNIGIHGITPARVEHEAEFGDRWQEISEALGDDCLVAHNANFDVGVLLACLTTHRKPIPDLRYSCTRAVARRVWPHRPRFGLKPLSEWLGIRFRHHDALEDSIACAKIMIAAGIDQSATSLDDLESKLRISRGSAGDWGKRGPASTRSRRKPTKTKPHTVPMTGDCLSDPPAPAVDMQRLLIRAEFIRPLRGKRVVFSGSMEQFNRDQAEALALRLGGICETEVSSSTDFVVVGKPGSGSGGDESPPSQTAQLARDLQQRGSSVEIVDEAAFLKLITTTG